MCTAHAQTFCDYVIMLSKSFELIFLVPVRNPTTITKYLHFAFPFDHKSPQQAQPKSMFACGLQHGISAMAACLPSYSPP